MLLLLDLELAFDLELGLEFAVEPGLELALERESKFDSEIGEIESGT